MPLMLPAATGRKPTDWTYRTSVIATPGSSPSVWVSTTPDLLVKAAVDLVDHSTAREAGLQVRAGLGYGEVLAINGDYFGNTVNLAARLVAAAEPGQILATAAELLVPSAHRRACHRDFASYLCLRHSAQQHSPGSHAPPLQSAIHCF